MDLQLRYSLWGFPICSNHGGNTEVVALYIFCSFELYLVSLFWTCEQDEDKAEAEKEKEKKEEAEKKEKEKEEEKKKEAEATFEMLSNPARVMRPQVREKY